jgi:hypothetical protein
MITLSMSKGHPHLHPPPSKGEDIKWGKFQIFWVRIYLGFGISRLDYS